MYRLLTNYADLLLYSLQVCCANIYSVLVNIFFKVRNRIKKVQFVGQTLDQLKDLFMKKFQDERENVFGGSI
jgi:hypothetical protein